MTSAVSFFDVRDSFQDVKTPKTSTSASTGNIFRENTVSVEKYVYDGTFEIRGS